MLVVLMVLRLPLLADDGASGRCAVQSGEKPLLTGSHIDM